MALLVVIACAFVVHGATTVAEREKFATYVKAQLVKWAWIVDDWYHAHLDFFDALRARTRIAPVTPAIAVANIVMFAILLVSGWRNGHDMLVEWGANLGPRTTNGEWWRLVSSLFIHAGPIHLLACLIGFLPLGLILERIVGPMTLLGVYIAAGVFSGLFFLATDPLVVSAGPTGAIFGLYGLAFATLTWGVAHPRRMIIPWGVLKYLVYAGLVFAAYATVSDLVPLRADMIGLIVGVACGIPMRKDIVERPMAMKRTSIVLATAAFVALAAAVPLRGIVDLRPDVTRLLETDEQTAATFRSVAKQLALGQTTEKALIALIEREIIPALERSRPDTTAGVVPDDQRPVVAAAREYVRLRIEGWRLRAAAYRKGSMSMLRQADVKDGAARDFLARHYSLRNASSTS